MSIPLITKNQFKETSRYLQEQLSKEFNQKIKLSTTQEALSKTMGFRDYHAYQHFIESIKEAPTKAQWANGDISKEIQSLNFCINSSKGFSGTQLRIKTILLHLYNNNNPVKFDLKNFDETHRIHILNVLALDARPFKEIHYYVDNGYEIFSKWAEEAHMQREWEKYSDTVNEFCDYVTGQMQGVSEKKLEEYISNAIKRELPQEVDWKLEKIKINDNFYRWNIFGEDKYKYPYSIGFEFDIKMDSIFLRDEILLNEE